jgi:hypothetical protein
MGVAQRKRTRTKVTIKPKTKPPRMRAQEQIHAVKAWDTRKTVKQNYESMGLAESALQHEPITKVNKKNVHVGESALLCALGVSHFLDYFAS